jgi:hypothetical protein
MPDYTAVSRISRYTVLSDFEPNRLKALWEAGVPLDEAWIEFASIFDRFAHRALRTDPANDPDVLGIDHPRYKELSKGWLPPTLEGRQKKLAITTKNERTRLLGEIYAGHLWAIGFRTLENGDDEAVRVPRQRFYVDEDGELSPPIKINWSKGELVSSDAIYFDVYVVQPPASDAALRSINDSSNAASGPSPILPTEVANASGAGRPNTNKEIRAKTRELWKEANFREIKSRIEQAREVRAQLLGETHRSTDDMPNYKSTVIGRIIGEVSKEQPRPPGGAA